MGVDLRIYINNGGTCEDWPYRICNDSLKFVNAERDLLDKIGEASKPLHEPVYVSDSDISYTEDDYGRPLTWINADKLTEILSGEVLFGSDKAIRAYLREIGPITRIILWWC